MADNVTTNGTTIAAEDVSGVYYQRWKIIDGRAAGTSGAPASAANGLWVDARASVTSAALTQVAAQRTVIQLTAANAQYRRLIQIWNTSNEWLYIRWGAGATVALAGVPLAPLIGFWEAPFNCTDQITGIWGTTLDGSGTAIVITGAANITEY